MAFEDITMFQGPLPDYFYVIKDEVQNCYWAINLEDHGGSFLLDKSYQQFISSGQTDQDNSYIVIQPPAR